MLKTILLNTIKLVIAGALIGWLVGSGKLDFKLLAQLKNHPSAVFIALILSVLNFWLTSWRWRKILKARTNFYLPMTGMMKVTWIGQFFSSVLPGSVSGDLVKVLYVQGLHKELSKKFIFASILIDRAMGLSGLILLVGLSSLLFSSHILEAAPAMAPLLNTNFILAGIVLLSLIVFFFFHGGIRLFMTSMEKLFIPKAWQKGIGLWDDLTSIRSKMMKAVVISLVVQFIGVLVFWVLIRPFVSEKMDFLQALAMIPLGLMTLALPVAPSGLGVGHAIFQKLFELSSIDNGASLFNLYFVLTLSVNLMGAIPYLLHRRKP